MHCGNINAIAYNNADDLQTIFTSLLPLLMTWPQQNEGGPPTKKSKVCPFFGDGSQRLLIGGCIKK